METLVRWECELCGRIYSGMVPPMECPNCGAPREKFIKLDHEPEGKVFVAEEHIPRHIVRWECDACGHVFLQQDGVPTECPNCGAGPDHFHILEGESVE